MASSTMLGPPAYLTSADAVTVQFEASDNSWRATLTRAKWREAGRPEVVYALVTAEVSGAD